MKKEEDESVKNPFSSLSGFYLDSLDKLGSLVNEDTEVKLFSQIIKFTNSQGTDPLCVCLCVCTRTQTHTHTFLIIVR